MQELNFTLETQAEDVYRRSEAETQMLALLMSIGSAYNGLVSQLHMNFTQVRAEHIDLSALHNAGSRVSFSASTLVAGRGHRFTDAYNRTLDKDERLAMLKSLPGMGQYSPPSGSYLKDYLVKEFAAASHRERAGYGWSDQRIINWAKERLAVVVPEGERPLSRQQALGPATFDKAYEEIRPNSPPEGACTFYDMGKGSLGVLLHHPDSGCFVEVGLHTEPQGGGDWNYVGARTFAFVPFEDVWVSMGGLRGAGIHDDWVMEQLAKLIGLDDFRVVHKTEYKQLVLQATCGWNALSWALVHRLVEAGTFGEVEMEVTATDGTRFTWEFSPFKYNENYHVKLTPHSNPLDMPVLAIAPDGDFVTPPRGLRECFNAYNASKVLDLYGTMKEWTITKVTYCDVSDKLQEKIHSLLQTQTDLKYTYQKEEPIQ